MRSWVLQSSPSSCYFSQYLESTSTIVPAGSESNAMLLHRRWTSLTWLFKLLQFTPHFKLEPRLCIDAVGFNFSPYNKCTWVTRRRLSGCATNRWLSDRRRCWLIITAPDEFVRLVSPSTTKILRRETVVPSLWVHRHLNMPRVTYTTEVVRNLQLLEPFYSMNNEPHECER